MKDVTRRRILAYLFDMLLMMLFMQLVSYILKPTDNLVLLTNELNTLYETILKGHLPLSNFIHQFIEILRPLDIASGTYSVINIMYIIIYFIIIPYLFDGQTLGKYLNKIKVEDYNLVSLIVRNFLTTSLAYTLICMMLMYLVSNLTYFIVVLILTIIQLVALFISFFMVLYRRDRRGLHDIITNTKVVIRKE
jgi:uncharacterized RDD family membrane protein YckC